MNGCTPTVASQTLFTCGAASQIYGWKGVEIHEMTLHPRVVLLEKKRDQIIHLCSYLQCIESMLNWKCLKCHCQQRNTICKGNALYIPSLCRVLHWLHCCKTFTLNSLDFNECLSLTLLWDKVHLVFAAKPKSGHFVSRSLFEWTGGRTASPGGRNNTMTAFASWEGHIRYKKFYLKRTIQHTDIYTYIYIHTRIYIHIYTCIYIYSNIYTRTSRGTHWAPSGVLHLHLPVQIFSQIATLLARDKFKTFLFCFGKEYVRNVNSSPFWCQ